MDLARLKEKLEGVKDPRRQWGNIRHKLEDIPVIGLVTLVCNGQDFEDMEVFAREREAELRKFPELPGGIPDASTFFRVFRRVNPAELSGHLYEWLAEARELKGTLINVDGKTIRGSGDGERKPVHVVSAWAGDEEIALGQAAADEKSNKITAIPKLLDLPDIKGATVTTDAMGESEYPAEDGACASSGGSQSPSVRQKENDRPNGGSPLPSTRTICQPSSSISKCRSPASLLTSLDTFTLM